MHRVAALLLVAVAHHALAVDLIISGLDGATFTGRAVRIAPELVLETESGETSFAWTDLIAVRPAGRPQTAPRPVTHSAGSLRFELTDGSRFIGKVSGHSEDGFDATVGDRIARLAASAVRSIQAPQASGSAISSLTAVLEETDRTEDVVIIARDGREATLRGRIVRIEPARILFQFQGKERGLDWNVVAAVAPAKPVPRGAACLVYALSGDVFAGRVGAGDAEQFTLQSAFFDELPLRWKEIERIECRSDRLTFLTDLRPARYDFTPFIAGRWELGVDRSLSGRPIVLGGKTYAKGLTMRSRANVLYVLNGRYKQFAAIAGIVDEMIPRGNVIMSITGDGRPLWQAENVRSGSEPLEVLVDVTGVEALLLTVDYGEDLDISDHACWAMARLIR